MRILPVVVAVLVSVVLQATLARYMVGGRWVFDLVLVGVVYAALQQGAVAGMLAGTLGGLLQDTLSGGILGVGGLTKTVTGYVTGGLGTQFVVSKPYAKAVIVAAATVVNRVMNIGLDGLIHQAWPVVSWFAILGEVGANTVFGFVVFAAAAALPDAMSRGRFSRRSTLSRRQW
jgi:rod shape-determining protein MreD